MGKEISHVYKHSQHNWPQPSTNTKFVVPPVYSLSPHRYRNYDFSATIFPHNKPSPVTKLTTTNKVDTDTNNDDNIQSFETPINHNNRNSGIPDTNTTTTSAQPNVHLGLNQKSYSTSTTSSNLPPSEK